MAASLVVVVSNKLVLRNNNNVLLTSVRGWRGSVALTTHSWYPHPGNI